MKNNKILIHSMHFMHIFVSFLISLLLISCGADSENNNSLTVPEEPAYYTHSRLETYLQQTALAYPEITHIEPIGDSVEGRTIWAFIVSDNPQEFEPEPKIRLTGAIHGNENSTAEVLIRLIKYLTDEYFNDNSRVKAIVDNTYIVIIPMMNPDGVENNSRENSNDVDLNRNFSVAWVDRIFHGDSPFSEPESRVIRDYSNEMVFHISLTYHDGAVVVNMPFDYASLHGGGEIPEEIELVEYLAHVYSTSGRFLETDGILDQSYVNEGAINGGDWYVANGTLQDWSYVETGCVDLTIEISNVKPESAEELDNLFELNKESILSYIEASRTGLYGRITNADNEAVTAASISINGGDIKTFSDDYGYYHRILLPGNYIVTYLSEGYEGYSQEITITEEAPLVELNAPLKKKK